MRGPNREEATDGEGNVEYGRDPLCSLGTVTDRELIQLRLDVKVLYQAVARHECRHEEVGRGQQCANCGGGCDIYVGPDLFSSS